MNTNRAQPARAGISARLRLCWRSLILATAVAGAGCVGSAAQGAGFTWTGAANNNWDLAATDLNWTTAWSNNATRTTPNTATFNLATPAAVTVNDSIDVGSITFATGGWTLSPGTGVLAYGASGTMTITTTTGADTIDAVIANGSTFGTGGGLTLLTKAGAGTLILGAANTYTGFTTVNAGTLQIAISNAIGTGSFLTVNSGATAASAGAVDLNGLNQSVTSLSGSSGAVSGLVTDSVAGTTSILTISGLVSKTFSGVLQNGAGKLEVLVNGSGTLTLAGQNNYTGPTILSGGSLSIASTGSIVGSAITVNAGSTLGVTRAAGTSGATSSVSLNSVTLDGGALSLAGNLAPASLLNSASTGGILLIDSGGTTFTAGGTNSLDLSSLPGGSSMVLGTSATISSTIASTVVLKPDLVSNTLRFGGGAGRLTVNAAIADIGGVPTNLSFSGTSTTALGGANSYLGMTTVNSGATVLVTSATGLGSPATGTTINTGGALSLSAASAEPFTVAGGTLTLLAPATGPISAASGSVRILAGGSVAPHSVVLSGGALSLWIDADPAGPLAAASTGGVLSIDTGDTNFTAGGTNVINFATLPGGSALRLGTTNGAIIAPAVQLIPDPVTNTLHFGAGAAGTLTYNGTIADMGATPTQIDVTGAATTSLGGANTYTGITTVNGPLLVTSAGGLGTGSGGDADGTVVNTGGVLTTAPGITLADEKITMNGGTINVNTSAPVVVNAASNLAGTFNGGISGNGAISFSGITTLAGPNSFTSSATIVSGGSVTINSAGTLGATASVTVDTGGTLNTGAGVTLNGVAITLNGGTADVSTTGPVDLEAGGTLMGTFGTIQGPGALSLGGTLTLASPNPYTGPTSILSGGTVTVTDPGALGSATAGTTVGTGAVLNINAASNEPITVSGGMLNINANAGGAITETAGAVNFFTATDQAVNVSGGTANIGRALTGPVNVSGGTVNISGSYSGSLTQSAGAITLSAPATFNLVTSGGTFTVNAALGGQVTVNGGNLEIGAAGSASITMNSGLIFQSYSGTNTIVANGGEFDVRVTGVDNDSITLGNVRFEIFLDPENALTLPLNVDGDARIYSSDSIDPIPMAALSGSGIVNAYAPLGVSGAMNFSGVLLQTQGGRYNSVATIGALQLGGSTTISSSIEHTGWLYLPDSNAKFTINGGTSSISDVQVSPGAILTINSNTTIGHLVLDDGILLGTGLLTLGDQALEFQAGELNFTGSMPGLTEIDKTTSGVAQMRAVPSGFTGKINVQAGELQLSAGGGSGPITVSGTGTLSVVNTDLSNPIFLNGSGGPNGALVGEGVISGPVDLGPGGSSFGAENGAESMTVTGGISGGMLTIYPQLSLTLGAPSNSFTGLTLFAGSMLGLQSTLAAGPINLGFGSALYIDNSKGLNADRVPDTSPILMQGANLEAFGATTESLGAVTAAAGFNRFSLIPANSGGPNIVLTLASLQRNFGAVVDFESNSDNNSLETLGNVPLGAHVFITGQAATNFMGGGYVYGDAGSQIGLVQFVKYDPVTGVTAMQDSDYSTAGETAWNASTIVMIPVSTTATLTASRSVEALKFGNPSSSTYTMLNLASNTLNVTGGGMIVAPNSTIYGSAGNHLTAGGLSATAELFLYGSAVQQGAFITVAANITDNPGPDGLYDPTPGGPLDADNGQVSVIFSGPQQFFLSGANTYTGTTYINGTAAFNNAGAVAPGPIVLSSGSFVLNGSFTAQTGPLVMHAGVINGPGTLSPGSLILESGTINAPLAGNGSLTKTTIGTATIANNTAFTGPITMLGGSLTMPGGNLPSNVQVQAGSLTLTSTLDSFTGNNLTVSPGAMLNVYGTLYLPTNLNLAGGTLNIYQLSFDTGTHFNWTSGILNFTTSSNNSASNITWDSGALPTSTSDVFGAGLTLTSGQTLIVTGVETIGGAGPFALTLDAGSTHQVTSSINEQPTGNITLAPSGTLTQNPGSTLEFSTFTQAGGTINGSFQNSGTFIYQGGAFNGRLINQGLAEISPAFTAGDGIENDTSLTLPPSEVITVNGSGLNNLGTFILAGGTLNGDGPMVNNGTFTGAGIIAAPGGFTNHAAFTQSGPQTWAPGTIFTNAAGTANFLTDAGAPGVLNLTMQVSGGTVNLAGAQHLLALSISGGTVTIAATPLVAGPGNLNPSATTSVVGGLSMAGGMTPSGTLNVNNNVLIVSNGGAVARDAASADVAYARNGGLWNQPGITSAAAQSTFAATHFDSQTLGVVLNSDLPTPYTALNGEAVSTGDVLIAFTYGGDANLDGAINGNDYFLIDRGFLNHYTGWVNGDFNYDGTINGNDYFIIDSNFIDQSGRLAAPEVLAHAAEFGPSYLALFTQSQLAAIGVPEPASLALLGLGAAGLLSKRRRKA